MQENHYEPNGSILIVDDDERIKTLLQKFFIQNNYNIATASNTIEAKAILEYFSFDLIILDVMMPGETGVEFTKNNKGIAPILLLSALSKAHDRINGLEVGADDYLAKPFEPKELLLRVRNLIKKSKNSHESPQFIRLIGDIIYNKETKQLFKKSESIILSSMEENLFNMLIENLNKPINREKIANHLAISERSVDVSIVRLRQKIEPDPKKPFYIRSIRNLGYGLYG